MNKEKNNSNPELISAICYALGYEENCYYIKIFRNFRKNYLEKEEEYSSLLEKYDTFNPMISKHIKHDRETAIRLLNSILNTIQYIQNKEYDRAIDVYNIMFNSLINKYNLQVESSNGRVEPNNSKSKTRRLIQNVSHS